MKAGAGHPMGPLTLSDFVGLDTLGSICDVLFDEFRERRFAQPPTLRKMLSAGWFGRKSGMGFYDYSGERPSREPGDLARGVNPLRRRHRAGARRRTRAPPREGARAGQAPRARARRAAARPRLVRRGGAARQLAGGWARRRRRRHRRRHARRPTGRADGQRPHRQGRLVGTEDGREDPAHPGARDGAAHPDGLPRGLAPARASPSRCRCSPAAAARGGSSTTR